MSLILRHGQAGNKFRVQDAEDERRDGNDETDQGAGSADVKERAGGANRRANQNEGAEGADQCGKRDEKGIAGVDVMVAASEEMAEFVGQQDQEQRQGERQTAGKS